MESALSNSQYKYIIAQYFDYTMDFEFLDIIADILDRIDDMNSEENIIDSIYDSIMYTKDQWTVIEYYCFPQTAKWDIAIENLIADIFAIIGYITNNSEN